MSIIVRVDDRLLHGQVTHGWLPGLEPVRVVVADDRAAGDEWERETFEASAPDNDVRVLGLREAARDLHAVGGDVTVLVLVRGPAELVELRALGFAPDEVIVGGLHGAEGRIRFADDLQISPTDARAFVALSNAGVHCYYQPLPSDVPAELPDLATALEGETGT